MVGEDSLVTAGRLACCLTVDRVECETQNPPQSHHVVARPGVVGLLRATTIYLSILCPELRWLMLTSLAVGGPWWWWWW